MIYNLSEEELTIVKILHSDRCLKSCRGLLSDLLKRRFLFKHKDANFDKTIQSLLNMGMIATVKKRRGLKYYISGSKDAIVTLNFYGIDTTPGKNRKL